MDDHSNTDPFPRCDLCHEAVQSDDGLTRCMSCHRDYCSNCGHVNRGSEKVIGTCMTCGRSKAGIV